MSFCHTIQTFFLWDINWELWGGKQSWDSHFFPLNSFLYIIILFSKFVSHTSVFCSHHEIQKKKVFATFYLKMFDFSSQILYLTIVTFFSELRDKIPFTWNKKHIPFLFLSCGENRHPYWWLSNTQTSEPQNNWY